MKIEDKKFNAFLNALMNLELIPIRAVKFNTEQPKFSSVLSELGETKENPISFNIESLTKEDIAFFKLCTEKKDLQINSINPKEMQVTLASVQKSEAPVTYKTVNLSKGLFNLIEYSFKTQKPVRLDFKGNSSVILKISTEGKLTAEFISSDAAMEYALKSSIPSLRQKMDAEGIPYNDIYYKGNNKDKDKDKNKKDKNKGGNK